MSFLHPAATPDDGSDATVAVPAPPPAPPADPTPVAVAPAPVAAPPAADPPIPTPAPVPAGPSAADYAALQAQLESLQAQITAAGQPAVKPERAIPSLYEVVRYAYPTPSGAMHTLVGIVMAVDVDNRQVTINWLPDRVAVLPVDDLVD